MKRTMPYFLSEVVRNDNNNCLQLAMFIEWRRLQLNMNCERAAELAGLELSQWLALESGWVPPYGENIWWALSGTLEIGINKITYLADISRWSRALLEEERSVGQSAQANNIASISTEAAGPEVKGSEMKSQYRKPMERATAASSDKVMIAETAS